MAKAKKSMIEKAVDQIYKNYETAQEKAIKEALEIAKNDIAANAVSCLLAYYDDYKPNSYNRTYSLINCFVPYTNYIKTKDGYECEAGVEFQAEKLNYVWSQGRSDIFYQQRVIDNFLAGIHTRTNGLDIPGLELEYYDYQEIQGAHVPWDIMQNFKNNYDDIFRSNLRMSMTRQILEKANK